MMLTKIVLSFFIFFLLSFAVLPGRHAYAGSVDISRYYKAPYNIPPPNDKPSDITFSAEDINNANTLGAAIAQIQPYLLKKYPADKVDPFLSVMWTMAIEGSGADPYSWNCNEGKDGGSLGKENISKGCRGWYNSGNWQVGYGIQVSQAASHLADDFKAIYGTSDAAKVQEVGNKVIQGGGITNPATMPAKSVEQLVQEAGTPGTIYVKRPTSDTEAAAQQAIAILLMDPAIGAASIAQEVAGDIGNDWVGTMKSWQQDYYINGWDPSSSTFFSNRIKALAEKYTGVAGATSGSSGNPDHAVSCVLTKVGNPKTSPPPLPPECLSGGAGGSCQKPPAPYPSDLKQTIIDKWGITFNGYDDEHLKWAYEELYAIQGTKFLPLVKNAIVESTPENISQQVGCPGAGTVAVRLHPYAEGGFKTLIVHELTHTLQWCQPDNVSYFSQIYSAVDQDHDFLSNYSRTACIAGVIQYNEDYADTVAYYLNPTAPEFTCGNGAGNPYAGAKHPAHKALAEKIVGTYSCQ